MKALRVMAGGTPVDKGVARSNYRVSKGSRTFAIIPAYSPGKDLGIGEQANLRAVLAQGRAALSDLKPGQAAFITNNVPYIEQLNNGSSKQSPGGFLEAGAAAARIYISTVRLFGRDIGFDDDELA